MTTTAAAVYTIAEVAAKLGIGEASVYRGLYAGQIPAHRVGSRWIIPREPFDRWFADPLAIPEPKRERLSH